MKRSLQLIYVFLVIIFSYRFFDAHFINPSFVNYVSFFSIVIVVLVSIPFLPKSNKLFNIPIYLILSGILISIFMAYIAWGQDLMVTLLETVPFLIWIFFFYLLGNNIPIKDLEKVIVVAGVLYAILYFFQLSNSSVILFGKTTFGDKFQIDRGIVRIVFPGGGIFVLLTFLALNKLTLKSKNKFWWIILLILGILIPVLQVTRVYIAGILVIYLYHFIRQQSIVKKMLIMVTFITLILVIGNTDNLIIRGLKEATASDVKEGGKYIRVVSATYFLTDFPPRILTRIFGNGIALTGITGYGKKMLKLNDRGYFVEDVGILGMYALFGILAVIGYVIIWYKSFAVKIPDQYLYSKYYLWFLLINGFTTFDVWHFYFIISTVFALYIFQKAYIDNKSENRYKQTLNL